MIEVVAGVIYKDNKFLIAQRNLKKSQGGLWEFPGGKIETNETIEEAIIREIKEELDTDINVGDLIDTIEYDYPNFHLSMDCFWCEILQGELELKEHESARWLSKEKLYSVDWLPADIGLIEKIQEKL